MDERCYSVVKQISALNYVTFEIALSCFLQEMKIPSLQALGVNSLPCLDAVWIIQNKVNSFIPIYMSQHGVISFVDLEEDLLSALRTAHLPMLSSKTSYDPNEIDLNESLPLSFLDYGVGDLRLHPLMQLYFPHPLRTRISYSDVIKALLAYVDQHVLSYHLPELNCHDFQAHVLRTYHVQDLLQLGLIIKSNMQEELLLVRKILSRKADISKAVAKLKYETNDPVPSEFSGVRIQGVPKVAPSSSTLRGFLEECQAHLGSVYSPSYSKLHAAVATAMTSQPDRRNLGIDLLTEYLMLCLGSSKYRARQFLHDEPAEESPAEDPLTATAPVEEPPRKRKTPDAQHRPLSITTGEAYTRVDVETHLPSAAGCFSATDLQLQPLASTPISAVSLERLSVCIPWTLHLPLHDNKATGRWGEALVYQYLLYTSPSNVTVEWVNDPVETLASYDIILSDRRPSGAIVTTFIEVKSTRYDDKNAFSLSFTELEFISKHPRPKYDIYRVYNAGSREDVRIVILKDVYDLMQYKKIALYLAV